MAGLKYLQYFGAAATAVPRVAVYLQYIPAMNTEDRFDLNEADHQFPNRAE